MWLVAFIIAGLILCVLYWKNDIDNRLYKGQPTLFDGLAKKFPNVGGALVKLWRSLTGKK